MRQLAPEDDGKREVGAGESEVSINSLANLEILDYRQSESTQKNQDLPCHCHFIHMNC